MKIQTVAGLLLILIGTNLFTYTTARYNTTVSVLTRASERLDTALRREGVYEVVYSSERSPSSAVVLAIRNAGGNYYWWNSAISLWGAGAFLAIVGGLVPFLSLRKFRVT